MQRSILIIEQFAEDYRSRIATVFPDLNISTAQHRREVRGEIGEVTALFGFGPSFDDELINKAKRLEWIQFLSTGTDALYRMPSLHPEVVVTTTHGVHGPPVSEMVFLHMLVLGRGYGRLLKNQELAKWEECEQPLLFGKTVTLVGVGLIAQELARRCKAFGMTVLGVSRTPRQLPDFDRMFHRSELEQAVGMADFLVLLVPLSPETKGIVDASVLAAMKPTAYVINVARGGVCDEDALLAALREKRIAGAGLDAFRTEPLPPEHPFWRMEHVVITPHIAGRSNRYADLVMPILLTNLKCFVESRWSDMVNPMAR